MNPIGLVHTAAAVLALASGALVLMMRKGTAAHRRVGWVYVGSMLGVNITAFTIYRLFGGLGPFHAAALLSLVTVVAGIIPAVRRRPKRTWVDHHYWWMTYSLRRLARRRSRGDDDARARDRLLVGGVDPDGHHFRDRREVRAGASAGTARAASPGDCAVARRRGSASDAMADDR